MLAGAVLGALRNARARWGNSASGGDRSDGGGLAVPAAQDVQPRRALRLTFQYRGDRVTLLARRSVEMRTFPTDPLEPMRDRAGFWYELQDERGAPLYRRAEADPRQTNVEVRTGDSTEPLARASLPETEGTFDLIVPDLAAARALLLFGSATAAPGAAARELARVELTAPPAR